MEERKLGKKYRRSEEKRKKDRKKKERWKDGKKE